ncbi:MAG TPA: hypothetical protein VNE38_03730 [Ktedonobacteraceae bacterium]|nr:hypothetical protein [Ktedonobacteraceae bacterium]
MIFDEPPNHTQRFEQAIATAFACRTIIKYNSTLGEEQKNEILVDLDSTLQFLQQRLIANAAIESHSVIPPLQLAELLAASAEDHEEEGEGEESEMMTSGAAWATHQEMRELSEPLMHNLYKLYHAYLTTQPGKGMHALETRYKLVMSILDDVEAVMRLQRDTSAGEDNGPLIHRVRGFITALYSMFHEFAAVLAELLEGKNIMTETDELTVLQKFAAGEIHHQHLLRDITPLMRVYGAHLQLKQSKGSLTTLGNDATAFFIFIEEQLAADLPKRQEIVEGLRSVAELFHDLASLLLEYEQAFSATLPQ